MALPMHSVHVTIISRRDCHLCRVVSRAAAQVREDLPFTLDRVDVATDQDLLTRYGNRVPVVLIDRQEVLSGKITAGDLREAIERARWKNPISRILSRVKLALTRG